MHARFDVIDCDANRAWRFDDEATAGRYAAARHAATGNVVEVVGRSAKGEERHFVLPPDAPPARRLDS